MKKITIIFMLVLFATINIQAQLFNKLKEKAAKALEPKKKTETATAEKQEATEEAPASTKKTKVKWQPTSDCSKLFTLEKGESFFYDETKVFYGNGKLSTAFVVSNK